MIAAAAPWVQLPARGEHEIASEEEVQRRIEQPEGLAAALAARGTEREQEAAFVCAWKNRRLVMRVVQRVWHHRNQISHEFDDLVQEGLIGVAHAITMYDPQIGAFSTYVVRWAVQAVMRAIDGTGQLVRRPHWVAQALRDLHAGRPLSRSRREVAEQQWSGLVSLDRNIGDGESPMTLLEVFRMEQPGAAEEVERSELCDLVARALASLNERERAVVEMRFRSDMTLRETGAALRVGRGPVSRQRTEQIEKLALAKLRRWFLRHAPWVRS
jgi:RNA polymerase sigma factor (sigma-70 family)